MSRKARDLKDGSITRSHNVPHMRNRQRRTTTLVTEPKITTGTIDSAITKELGARQERHSEHRIMKQILAAEQRAKHFAANYSRRFRWQIDHNVTLTFGTWDPIGYDTEILRSQNAKLRNGAGSAASRFEHFIGKGSEGTWLYHASIMVAFTSFMALDLARIAFFKNGVLYSSRDAVDVGYAGENPILDVKLAMTDLIAMERGDVMTVRIYMDNGGAGDQLFGAPTSIQGHVIGMRVNCDTDEIGSVASGNGSGYTFT